MDSNYHNRTLIRIDEYLDGALKRLEEYNKESHKEEEKEVSEE